MQPFLIRNATFADAAVIAENNLALAYETENLKLNPARVRDGVQALLDDAAKGTYYVAEVEGVVAGQLLITYEWSDWRNGNYWWLQSVYIGKEFRSRGIFRALYAHVIDLAKKDKNSCGIRLYVENHNGTAQAAYEKLGMQRAPYAVFEQLFSR
jgi:ribosomal protein S18 acetylase RimI-like enzyme